MLCCQLLIRTRCSYIQPGKSSCFQFKPVHWTYMKYRRGTAKYEVHGALDIAVVIVMPTLVIKQGVMRAEEGAVGFSFYKVPKVTYLEAYSEGNEMLAFDPQCGGFNVVFGALTPDHHCPSSPISPHENVRLVFRINGSLNGCELTIPSCIYYDTPVGAYLLG